MHQLEKTVGSCDGSLRETIVRCQHQALVAQTSMAGP